MTNQDRVLLLLYVAAKGFSEATSNQEETIAHITGLDLPVVVETLTELNRIGMIDWEG